MRPPRSIRTRPGRGGPQRRRPPGRERATATLGDRRGGGDGRGDGERSAYLLEHVRAVHAAIARGVDVCGYFAWSLLDNFEWSFGYDRRFGLVRVDYATQKRLPKESFWTYAALARAHAVPASGPVTTVADSPDFAHAPTGV